MRYQCKKKEGYIWQKNVKGKKNLFDLLYAHIGTVVSIYIFFCEFKEGKKI